MGNNETTKAKYTDDDFMDAINELSQTSNPSCSSFRSLS